MTNMVIGQGYVLITPLQLACGYAGVATGTIKIELDAQLTGKFGELEFTDGVVTFAGWRGGYGNCVVVDHGDGMETLYAHLYRIGVEVGQELKAGDQVGNIGSTGNSTGPHLHFEVHIDGIAVDPLLFVDYDFIIYD